MPLIQYITKRFNSGSKKIIEQANQIIDEYTAQGYSLTLRQIYYQFVSRDIIANKQTEYKRLGSVINNARLAGLIDWDSIEDRTRNLKGLAHWEHPREIIDSAASQFRLDRWESQRYRPEIWIEKDALTGILDPICRKYDIPYFSCRGYTSQSEMWGAAMRLDSYRRQGQIPYIIHFGDHDPSGIDMSQDIEDRMSIFNVKKLRFKRVALNMNQVEKYQPPPNPAKETDSRCNSYIAKYGDESWELDALEPKVITAIIEKKMKSIIDKEAWQQTEANEAGYKEQLEEISDNMD